MKYPQALPNTSIIITFHNEAWSTLLRTVTSVINRSPKALLHEIILVDDQSSKNYLKEKLDVYISELSQASGVAIRILRAEERLGIVRARMMGAKNATGSVLTFLDSHCECNEGWLESLLSRIAEDHTRVVSPMIDIIDDKTFEYHEVSDTLWGGFNWRLQYKWLEVPERERSRRGWNQTMPLSPPVMGSGIFSIDRAYFKHIGEYDDAMRIWGQDNIELSIRVWACGGSLEMVPCSRVGHVFRFDTPYMDQEEKRLTNNNNVCRIVDLWYSEWMMFFYNLYPYTLEGKEGDVNGRREIIKNIGCKGVFR